MKTKMILICAFCMITFNSFCQLGDKLKFFANNTDDPDLGSCSEKILISINGTLVNAYHFNFCDAVGGDPSFLKGNIKNNSIYGTRTSLLYNDAGIMMGEDQANFKIEFTRDADGNEYIKYYRVLDSDCTHLYASRLTYSFVGGNKNLRESPNTAAKILSKIDVQKSTIKLLEIGNCEKIGQTFDFWYKVIVNGTEGWLFGGLSLD